MAPERPPRGLAERAGAVIRRSAPGSVMLAVGATPFVVSVAMIPADGGFSPSIWLPAGIVLVALALTAHTLVRGGTGTPTAALVAVAAIAGFAVWSAVSAAWAGERSIAWEGANRTMLYAALFALYALARWSSAQAAVILGGYVALTAAVGLWTVLRALDPGDPTTAFDAGRLATPIPYSNANAALFLAALWPALGLAAHRATPPIARGAMYAASGLFVELAVLSQSRAALGAVPIVALVLLVASPDRIRLVVAGGLVAAVVAVLGGGVLDVYEAIVNESDAGGAIDHARLAVVASVACLFVLGTAVGVLDRAALVPRPPRRLVVAVAIVAAAVTGGVALTALVQGGDPRDRVTRAWEQFRTNERDDYAGPYLTSGFGSNRYDLWRVALEQFATHPVQGIGADNFRAVYLEERRTDESPLYPHSFPLRVLSQTGIVGAGLVGLWLGAAYALVLGGRRRRSRGAQLIAVSGSMMALYWLAHGAVDWFWEIPALGVPAVAALGLAARLEDPQDGATGAPQRHRLTAWVAAAAAAAAALSLAAQWALDRPARDIEEAVDARLRDRSATPARGVPTAEIEPTSGRSGRAPVGVVGPGGLD